MCSTDAPSGYEFGPGSGGLEFKSKACKARVRGQGPCLGTGLKSWGRDSRSDLGSESETRVEFGSGARVGV
uniref:Uncharacterized protein n=1 Tax=Cannabis sativa TaxID=3483 RepID=A0A803PQ27_CANSA